MANEHVTSGGYTFSQHQALAAAWCRWNGQKGTEKQALRLMGQESAPSLARLLAERGALPIGCERPVVGGEREACPLCDGDGFGPMGGNCERCGGGGRV